VVAGHLLERLLLRPMLALQPSQLCGALGQRLLLHPVVLLQLLQPMGGLGQVTLEETQTRRRVVARHLAIGQHQLATVQPGCRAIDHDDLLARPMGIGQGAAIHHPGPGQAKAVREPGRKAFGPEKWCSSMRSRSR
jgi:hypothetical protein